MSDLIDRQQAIDALYHVDEYNGRSVEAIRNLPSAQPYTDEEIQKMQDLEQAQIDKAFELGQEDARSDIVQCKECINHGKEICYFWSHFYGTVNTPDDGFCYKAERRTDESDRCGCADCRNAQHNS